MAFATEWLRKRALFPQLFSEPPDIQTGIIVVVPAFDEPGIATLLNSLASCDEPECRVEVIIIINAHSAAGKESLRNNAICIDNIEKWKNENRNCFFRLYYFDAGQPALNDWGVGLARKTGMDEALRRFTSAGNTEGVIVSLDADCSVDQNYFCELFGELYKRKDRKACSIRFQHPVVGNEFTDEIYSYVANYELHMRYFFQAVNYSGYPYTFHAIGSAIAFRASAYLKAGGMNRKQAGEDFYFIQKLIPQGGFFALNSTTVYPSPRTSNRVPFGTGTVMLKQINGNEADFLTYNPAAFRELRFLFSRIDKLFSTGEAEITDFHDNLPPGIRAFTCRKEWLEKITEINNNTSSKESFLKRFYGWFNMFRIVKYLNYVHSWMFEKQRISEAAYEMLSEIGSPVKSKDPCELLICYRKIEMGS